MCVLLVLVQVFCNKNLKNVGIRDYSISVKYFFMIVCSGKKESSAKIVMLIECFFCQFCLKVVFFSAYFSSI
jgi:hypothetical protein